MDRHTGSFLAVAAGIPAMMIKRSHIRTDLVYHVQFIALLPVV